MKLQKSTLLILIVPAALAVIGCVSLSYLKLDFFNERGFVDFYKNSLREPLFSGFLTIGAFLFSLKTFILTVMKTDVYDTEEYKKLVERQKAFDASIKRYDNLRILGNLLFDTVFVSLLAAIMQFSIGFLNYPVASILCISFSFSAMVLLLVSLRTMQENLAHIYNSEE